MNYANAYYARHTEDKLRKTLSEDQIRDLDLSMNENASGQELLALQKKYTSNRPLDTQILFHLAQNPSTPTAAIDGMINNIIGGSDSNSNIRIDSYHRTSAYLGLAMENPRISVYLMEKLCNEKIVDFQSIQARRHHLAKNPSLPYDLQSAIFEQETDPQILGALAMNPNCDREFLGALVRSDEWPILRDACKNPNLLQEDLELIAKNPQARRFVLENPAFDTSGIDIYKEKSADLGFIAQNPNTTQAQLRDIELQISVFKNMNDAKIDAYIGIASHPDLDNGFLNMVCNIPDTEQNQDLKERTLVAAALNPTITEEQQIMLLEAKTSPSYDLSVPLSYNPNLCEKAKDMIMDGGNAEALKVLGYQELEPEIERE